MPRKLASIFSPSRTVLCSMLFTLIGGTMLLGLPIARIQFVPLIDLIFTATSSLCVTGLLTVPLNNFTHFGQIVIMVLIQIGGLGLITLTLFTVSLFTELGLATQVMAGEMLDLETWSNTKNILLFIIGLTLACELCGAFILFQSLKHHYPFSKACFYALFQSVSAFCNAGIDITEHGMQQYSSDYSMLCTMSTLMFLGGLGFITLQEVFIYYSPFQKLGKKLLSLQTRIIVSYLSFLFCANTFIFWLLERKNTFEFMTVPQQIVNAMFTATSCRSTGFLTVYANDMQLASLFSIMVNAFIGSAPGSTGSGIKITTTAIIIAIINTAIRGKTSVDIKGRRIMQDQIYKALAVVALSILWILAITFCLLITEPSWHFIDIMLEALAAFSTVGISIGITPYLSIIGKILIIITMFVGRIGSLTLLIALRKRNKNFEFSYPQERVMIS